MIDQGIGLVLTPRKVRALAVDLGLSLVSGATVETEAGDLQPSIDLMSARPFLPDDSTLFDLRAMHATLDPLDIEFARAALRETLLESGSDPASSPQLSRSSTTSRSNRWCPTPHCGPDC